jgi:hypothetical protein
MGQMRRGWHLQGQILQNSISAEKVFGWITYQPQILDNKQ